VVSTQDVRDPAVRGEAPLGELNEDGTEELDRVDGVEQVEPLSPHPTSFSTRPSVPLCVNPIEDRTGVRELAVVVILTWYCR
jgi:hypothetical protein